MANLILVTYRACGCTLEIPSRDAKEEPARAASGEVCPRCRATHPTPDTDQKRRGTPRPGNGGARPGAGRKSYAEKGLTKKESTVVAARVTPDIAEWIKANGGGKFHADLLRKAMIDNFIV